VSISNGIGQLSADEYNVMIWVG